VKKIIFSLIAVVMAVAMIGSAFAYFSDTESSDANVFSSGTLSINNELINGALEFNVPNMAPGEVTDWYVIDIVNDGNINLAWLGDWQFTGNAALMNALYFAEAKMEFLTPSEASTGWLDYTTSGYETGSYGLVDHFIANGVGAGPYGAGFVSSGAPLGSFGVYTFNAWNNNPLMVPGSVYEHAGALKPGYKYKLSVKFGMAAGAGNEYQNLGPVNVVFKVDATQINTAAIQGYTGSWADITWLNNQITDQAES
jgi:predicted ribosomally synthesized peptide with SipW-like signal peptide